MSSCRNFIGRENVTRELQLLILNDDKVEGYEQLRKNDARRQERVRELLKHGWLKTAEDYEAVMVIFQHGETTENYYLALSLAKKPMN